MPWSTRHLVVRYGVSVLAVVLAAALLSVPDIRRTDNVPVLVFYAAILVAAWYGGRGPGLLATGLIGLLTLPGPLTAWQAARLGLFVAGGATVSLLIGALHAARCRAEAASRRALEHLAGEQAARSEAEAANRAKDEFLAVLSHELRTPLTPVLLAVSTMLEDGDAPQIRPTLEMIRRNVELEARLIDDLLDVARIAEGKLRLDREVVDAHVLVLRALEICRAEVAAGGLHLELDLSAAAHHVEADPTRLQQVFWNLIRNAAKFTPAGGRLVARSHHQGDPSGGRLAIEVTDNGIGIDPGQLAVIFDAFRRGQALARRQFGGLGLGLAISRALVEAHGGRLTAASAGEGQGATFTVELSTVAPPEAVTGVTSDGRGLPAEGRPLRILLVEDDASTLRVLARLLRARRCAVTTAGSVAEALAAGKPGDFDLIVSDIGLPDGTGWELMQRLRERGIARGIALTGFGREEDERRSREAGFVTHLTKPVDFLKLEATIQQIASAG